MKKIPLLILLAFSLICFSQSDAGVVIGNYYATGGDCDDSSCTGFDVCQNFEGEGYDNSESWTESNGEEGTIDEDEAGTVLRGSQSLEVIYGSSGGYVYSPAIDQGELYFHLLFRTPDATPASSTDILKLWTSGIATRYTLELQTNGTVRLTTAGNLASTTDSLSDNTTYHFWGYWKKGAEDEEGWFEFTALATRTPVGSGNKYVEVTGGTNNDDIRYLTLLQEGGTQFWDQILVKTTAFTAVCE